MSLCPPSICTRFPSRLSLPSATSSSFNLPLLLPHYEQLIPHQTPCPFPSPLSLHFVTDPCLLFLNLNIKTPFSILHDPQNPYITKLIRHNPKSYLLIQTPQDTNHQPDQHGLQSLHHTRPLFPSPVPSSPPHPRIRRR